MTRNLYNANPYRQRIVDLLAENNLTQAAAARAIGMTPQAFGIGIGSRSIPKVRRFICELAGRPESEFWPPAQKTGPKPKNIS